jgi:hypothetical protein
MERAWASDFVDSAGRAVRGPIAKSKLGSRMFVVTFSSGRTNVLQGAVHLLLFVTFILLMVQG